MRTDSRIVNFLDALAVVPAALLLVRAEARFVAAACILLLLGIVDIGPAPRLEVCHIASPAVAACPTTGEERPVLLLVVNVVIDEHQVSIRECQRPGPASLGTDVDAIVPSGHELRGVRGRLWRLQFPIGLLHGRRHCRGQRTRGSQHFPWDKGRNDSSGHRLVQLLFLVYGSEDGRRQGLAGAILVDDLRSRQRLWLVVFAGAAVGGCSLRAVLARCFGRRSLRNAVLFYSLRAILIERWWRSRPRDGRGEVGALLPHLR
mmetsp:Transcript_63038/g.186210  ORF Transcript_63038/g.186210 Transcript_63038/m.186210 type:complete len:261 (-) Transcript_63038:2996-3778(-)